MYAVNEIGSSHGLMVMGKCLGEFPPLKIRNVKCFYDFANDKISLSWTPDAAANSYSIYVEDKTIRVHQSTGEVIHLKDALGPDRVQ